MSNTVAARIYTAAFPLITANSLKYALYKNSSPLAEVASQTFTAPHPARAVSFPGLERTNYIFRLLEMSGSSVVQVRADFQFVPDNNDIKYKAPQMIQVGTTTGFIAGTNSFVFDGTGGTDDWRGYNIQIEKKGSGTEVRNYEYSWDIPTGTFTLLTFGDVFGDGDYWNAEFELILNNATGGTPGGDIFKVSEIIDSDRVLVAADIGKNFIIKGATDYLEITLPDISTVVTDRVTFFESGTGMHKCVVIKNFVGDVIDFMKGGRPDIKMGICESVAIYKNIDSTIPVWRVMGAVGNFLSVGRIIESYADISDEFNILPLDGGGFDGNTTGLSITSYARLYEWIENLTNGVVSFSSWSANKTKFSTQQGGFFHIPDLRDLYASNSGAETAGTYLQNQNKAHTHTLTQGNSYTGGGGPGIVGRGSVSPNTFETASSGGTKARPETIIVNKYILI